MSDEGSEHILDITRRNVDLERAADLVERGLGLERAISEGAFVSVSAARAHSLALKRDGSLWGWGNNKHGQLGLGDRDDRDRPARIGGDSDWAVAAVSAHTLALKRDGSLWAWGFNYNGQLGLGDAEDRPRPMRVSPHRAT